MAWVNEDLQRQFAEIAALLALDGADRFRVRAYERAADAIAAARVDLSTLTPEQIAELDGIGTSTAKKITEYLTTGRIGMLEELRAKVPPGVVALRRVPGVGPKLARTIYERLGVDSVEGLREAIDARLIRTLPGCGPKTEENLREALRRIGAKDTGRIPAADAIGVARELVKLLSAVPGVIEVTYAGSLRRMAETVGDIDILAASEEPAPVMEAFRSAPLVRDVLAAGEKKSSVLTVRDLQADLRVVRPEEWGAALVYFTGSKAHNVRLRERAVRRNLLLNEYGLYRRVENADGTVSAGERLASRTEADVYSTLGLVEIPAPMREDAGEVDAAANGRLPRVVTLRDMRGDLHGHSDWSGDGKASLLDMVTAAAERGYDYWAVTDHAIGLPMNGIDWPQILERRKQIAEVSERVGLRILEGLELNIGIDGGLDFDEECLATLDWNVASVHTLMQRPAAEQTERIIRAMQSPAVHAIGHPTGRKIGMRPGYEIDFEAILEAARETGTALEINASPRRLDLSGEMVRRAVEAGVALTISCDAHSIGDLDNMRYGVATAQRGWATPTDIVNCRDLEGLLAFTAAKRERLG